MVDGRSKASPAPLEGLLLPWRCLCCGASADAGVDLCAACQGSLPWNDLACPRCALPLAAPPVELCAECLADPPPFTCLIAPLRYAFPVDRLLVGLKFQARLENGRLLGELFATRLGAVPHGIARGLPLLPMPLHRARLAARGFNQAGELARPVAAGLGLRLEPDLVRRVRATPAQSRLDAAARRRNLAGAFAVTSRSPRCVLVLDDVVTTGATARELSATLRAAGAEEIVVLALARAGRQPRTKVESSAMPANTASPT